MIQISKAWKATVAAIGTVTTALSAVFADEVLDVDEAGGLVPTLVLAVATIYGVWKVPNRPDEPLAKTRAKLLASLDQAAELGRIADEQARSLRRTPPPAQ
ncbi:hypothetical protein [Amycolatopsis palatopharyngis]|uniref:hypothetical protein n=1 Tax=Amycolatopsis palatopharyngis TaxID=187982 RepID=UPI000E252D4A|nr:hypothetical protein [Amycolatopsis palatopharyngis]